MDQQEVMKKMMMLNKGITPRQPTDAENYFQNFWVPAKGQSVFSPEYPGEESVIEKIEKRYPEQAVAKTGDEREVIYLQDWWWSPKFEELDELLKSFGVKIYDDMLERNGKMIPKPTKLDHYKKVIQTIRMYGYMEGDNLLETYLEGINPNAPD